MILKYKKGDAVSLETKGRRNETTGVSHFLPLQTRDAKV